MDYKNLCYPQYEDEFTTISKDVIGNVKKYCIEKIEEDNENEIKYEVKLKEYKILLDDFVKRHPDYNSDPAKYERLQGGTTSEWDEYETKVKSGFEFAPVKPYKECLHPDVRKHILSILDGKVPFGLKIQD